MPPLFCSLLVYLFSFPASISRNSRGSSNESLFEYSKSLKNKYLTTMEIHTTRRIWRISLRNGRLFSVLWNELEISKNPSTIKVLYGNKFPSPEIRIFANNPSSSSWFSPERKSSHFFYGIIKLDSICIGQEIWSLKKSLHSLHWRERERLKYSHLNWRGMKECEDWWDLTTIGSFFQSQ